jgi:hypothetical protein
MKRIEKVLHDVLVPGEKWNMYMDKMLNNINVGGVNDSVEPKDKAPPTVADTE